MMHTVITALLLVVMLLIIASLFFSAWRAHQRYKRKLATAQPRLPAHPLDHHVTAILQVQDGNIVSVEEPEPPPPFTLSSSWYNRHRTIVSLGFLIMVILTLFVQSGLAEGTLENISKGLEFTFQRSQTTSVNTGPRPVPQTASMRLVRIDSADPRQYRSNAQRLSWMYSSCSGMAMTMVMNAYGRNLIAGDVLQTELDLGVWNSQLGLLREEGITMTAAHYGFDAALSHTRTLQEVITIANKGKPVIVSLRDNYYFPGGHIFVIRGGDSQYVFTADSAPTNFQRMTHAMFLPMWQANRQFSAVLTPRN